MLIRLLNADPNFRNSWPCVASRSPIFGLGNKTIPNVLQPNIRLSAFWNNITQLTPFCIRTYQNTVTPFSWLSITHCETIFTEPFPQAVHIQSLVFCCFLRMSVGRIGKCALTRMCQHFQSFQTFSSLEEFSYPDSFTFSHHFLFCWSLEFFNVCLALACGGSRNLAPCLGDPAERGRPRKVVMATAYTVMP